MNSKDSTDPAAAGALPPEMAADDEPGDDCWLGYESTHPLTWIPESPGAASALAA